MAVPRNIYAIAEYFLFIVPMLGLHDKYITLVNEEGGLNFQSIWLNTADIIKVVPRIIFKFDLSEECFYKTSFSTFFFKEAL